jgi:hypothetical protein
VRATRSSSSVLCNLSFCSHLISNSLDINRFVSSFKWRNLCKNGGYFSKLIFKEFVAFILGIASFNAPLLLLSEPSYSQLDLKAYFFVIY